MTSGKKRDPQNPAALRQKISELEKALVSVREELDELQSELKDASERERQLIKTETLLEKRTLELRESARQYKAIFDNSVLGIYKTTPAGRYLSVNQAFARIAGFESPEKMISEITDIGEQLYVDPRVRYRLRDILTSQGSVENFLAEIKRRDGRIIWVSINARAVMERGQIHYEGTVQDVTVRRNTEEALRQSEEKFAKAFQASQVLMAISTFSDGKFVDVNRKFLDMLGFSREEVIGRTSTEIGLFTRDSRTAWTALVAKNGSVSGLETVIKAKNGEKKLGIFSAEVIELKGEKHLLTVMQDITDRVRAEEAKKASDAQYRRLVEMASEGIWEMGADRRTIFTNRRLSEMFGHEHGEMIGRLVTDFMFEEDLPAHEARMKRRIRGEGGKYEQKFRRRDGSAIWCIVSATSIVDGEGEFLGSIAMMTDITELKKAEEARIKLEEQLLQAAKMESIGRLAGGIAHDFNNLLTPIIGYTGLLLETTPQGVGCREELEGIRMAAERARALTRQLLAFGRKQILEIKPVDLERVVTGFEKILRSAIRENIRIEIGVRGPLPPVRADAGQIEQVLMNLAVNAQDAMPSGGSLRISLEDFVQGPSNRTEVQEMPDGRYVLMGMQDTGCGMDRSTLDRLFEPFFTTKGFGGGFGLGLSMVYGIVRQHGGFVHVSSEPGSGTLFRIYLPAADGGAESVPEERKAAVGLAGAGETILVVEDNEMVRNMAARMLEKMGYRVLTADCGDACDEKMRARAGRIDLLLTDVIMPGMNGRELYEKLHAGMPDLRVLYMSGYDRDVIACHGILGEGLHFLHKPFTMEALGEKLREALGPGSPPAESTNK